MDVKRHNGMGPLTSEEKRLYESNLSKYKDERDAIQKKTFTKWVNKHLKKTYAQICVVQDVPDFANRHITDLFTDLQDGLNLISLLEVLSGEQLHREKGRMRFHALQNVELVLNFLRYKKIKLVNIRPEDIVDGNPKLTLGLIWTIILHFQISDIVVGEEPNVSARDVLLRWARKSTSRYPGVKVTDFTSSWRDGLAFNALIHRNRPDLIDWQHVRQRNVRERLETAFHSAEKVGVTRLLDPEDVDTHEIDEKSIITYISSMYDVFPEPPQAHPLYDNEGHSLTNEYRDVASSIHLWIREKTSYFSDRSVPNNFDSLLKLSQDVQKFKTVEVPQRAGQRMELNRLYTDLQKIYESTGEVDIEPELHVDVLERGWNKLMSLHEEREHQLQEELKKYEKFDRLAERCSRDIKRLDGRLDDVESRLKEEARRLERLHPMDAKRNADAIESELRAVEESLQSVSRDVATLKSVNHVTAPNLEKKLSKVHQKWVSLRAALHQKLISRLASLSFPVVEERTVTRQTRTVLETRLVDTNHHFRSLQQAIDWCKQKLKQLQETELGNDVPGTKIELAHHQREHKEIDKFQSTVDQCVAAKNQFQGEEQNLYSQHLSGLHKAYSELLTFSTKRMSDLESLLDFLNSAQNLLNWLTGKENIEVARDWSDPNINLQAVEQYHETLMSELEKREVSVRAVIERGNSLALQGHPGAKTISRWTELMKETWSRLLQFSLACEIHTEATRKYQEFMKDLREAEAWLASRDELLNTVYSASEFSLDEGERLLKGMQELREELNKRASAFAELASRAPSIPPIKARRQPVTRPIQINAVCNYSSQEDQVFIEKDDVWLLHDNSALTHWRVSNLTRASQDTNVPSVAFLIPPPGKEPLEGAERLNRAFERTTSLWQRKQMRLRQNMIFATIRVVRSWDLAQFVGMGSEQRSAIRRALNEDADKLLSEGDPGDPQLRRLRREMDEVNRLFDEFERRARQEDEQKTALREFNEMVTTVQTNLDEFERALNQRLVSPIPRDPHSLERLVLQHKTFETELKALTPQIDGLQSALNSLPRKPPQAANKVESLLQQWNSIWNYSHLYVERLKCVEIVLASLDEAKNVVSELEIKLAGFGELPSELEPLRLLHDDLIRVQNAIAARQPVVDQLIDDATNVRRLVVKSRERTTEREHHDLDRLDEDVNMVTRRWNDLCANLVERLRSCEQAGALLDNFGQTYQTEIKFIDESYQQLNSLPPVSQAKHHVEPTKVLFTSIVERTQPLEQVNIDGGRFIREAKIYSASMKRFEEATAVNNPSYDIVEDRPVYYSAVEEKLDNLNQRFLTLASVMQDRLRQLAALITDDQQLQDYVSGLRPVQLRTFRTVFSLSETTKQIAKWTENGNMGNVQNGSNGATEDELEGVKNPQTGAWMSLSEAIKSRVLDLRSGTVLIESGERVPVKDAVDMGVMRVGGSHLVEEARRELKSAEGGVAVSRPKVVFKKFLDSLSGHRAPEAVMLPPVEEHTSEWSLRQVVEQGILNPERGVFLIPGTDREVTLYECVKLGYIHPDSAIVVKSAGKEFNLKRALDKGVINKFGFVDGDNLSAAIAKGRVIFKDKISEEQAKKNRVKLKVSKNMNPEQLALWGHYDVANSQFKNFKAFLNDLEESVQVRGPSGELIPLKPEYFDDAGNYLAGAVAVPFLRAVKMGWIVGSGKDIVSPVSAVENIKFEDFPEAVLNNKLDPDLVKIKISDEKGYVPLRQAVSSGHLDLKSGINPKLKDAFESLAIRPNRPGCSLEALLKKTDDGTIIDPLTGRQLTLKEALQCELIDPSLTQVYDSKTAKWIPLGDVKELDVPLSPGHVTTVWPSPLSIPKALESSYYSKHSNKFYDPRIDQEVTLKEALESHLLDPTTALVRDPKNDNCLPLENALEVLDLEKGTFKYPTKMSLGEAYRKGYVLPSAPPMTLPEAVLQGLSTQGGILIKNEVMPVKESLEAQLIRDTKCLVNDDNLITPSEAIESEQMDPVSGEYKGIPLAECLATNILLPLKSLTFEEAEQLNLLQDQAPKQRLPFARMSIKDAIEANHLNPVTGLYTKTNPKLSFREACDFYLDPNSALVKDTQVKKYISLVKSFKSGLVNDTGHVLDKSSSTLVPLSAALSTNLMSLGSFTLFDSLDYSLYNPTSGTFHDPMNKRRVNLTAAVDSNLIMPDSVVVRTREDESERFIDLKTALENKLIDGETSTYKESENSLLNLNQAREKGYIVLASRRQAAEEKYKFCHDSFRQLFDWLAEVESRLAAQQPASESVNGLRNQINVLKLIKEELDSQFKMVTSVQDDARAVISTGGEFFTRDEISTLEKASKNLKTRYDRALATTEKLLKRLGSAGDELKKFRSETQIFSDWLEKAKKTASDREKSATLSLRNESMGDFLSDVISHQADLRFITMAAQKFSDESKEYLNAVNEFRGALMTRPGLIEPPVTSELKQLVTRLTSEYKELLARVSALSDRMSTLGSKTKEYKSALERARQWMSTAEPSANKVLSESLGADPSSLDEQLSRCKILYTEFTAQSRLFDQLKAALDALVRSLDPDRARTEAKELTRPVDELVTRYETLHGALKSRISSLQNALEASQGVESSLEQVLAWLNTAENNIKTLSRPASLIKPRLDEQVRNARAPLADIEEKKPTVESVAFQAKQLVASATNPRLAKRIESKLRDMQTRYEKLLERTLKLNESLNEVSKSLDDFDHRARDIEKWLVDTTETVNMGGPGAAEAAAVERDAKKDSIEKLLRDGRNLVSRKDVTDTSAVRDVIKNIESQFRDLSNLIDEKSRLARLRSEQSLSYEKLKEQILAWIAAFENRLSHLEPVALHADILKRQTDEIKPLVKEHRDYAINIDKLYELGAGLETLDRPESPVRRVSSPIKRLSTTLGRRSSQELTSPSPTKFFAASPVSPAASSGFGSRRSSSSQDVLGTPTGMSVTARETLEIAEAYTSIGTRLSERSAELDQTREELKRAQEQMKTLEGFIERTSRNLPRESLPGNREEADKLNKIVKGLLEDMYEKQYLLDNTKTTVNELLRRKAAAPGSEALERQLNELSTKWKSLYDICKLRITLFEDLKDLYDTLDHLTGWLSAKERLVNALGPISSDPRMVASQVEQVQVLREEMRATRPQLDHLEETTRSLAARANWHALESKLNQIQERWNSLAKKLDDRAACLGAAADSSREFDSGLSRLRDTLQNISDQIDSASDEKDPEQVLRKLNACDRQLEGARQLLADAEAAGEQLCSVLTDPGSRAEIQSKLAAVNKQYNQLQSKLDQRKAEIEGYLKDGRELDLELAKTVGWLGEELASLNNERLLVSADKDQLIAQVETHEPIYKEVLGREHQIVMLLDKAQGLLKTSEKAQYRNLESLRFQWDKLKKEVVDRHTRLHTSLEHCRKYYKSYDSFLPWLNQCEVKFDSLSPESFSRRELDKHLRDLASFRNDIWKKSGEFEHLRSLSETFLGSCDVDKERVTREMQNVKNRWDRLNQDLLNRTTALEEIGRKIADASDRLRSLAHSVQRCEDRLGSHDTLAGNSDPAQLARLAGIKDEVLSLAAPLDSLGHTCAEIDEEISLVANSRVKSSGLSEEVQALRERLEDLSSRLSDRVDRAQSAAKAVQQYNDKVKLIVTDLSALEDELAQMKPPGRDMKTLRSQQDHLSSFNSKVNRAGDEVAVMASLADSLIDSGFSPDVTRQQAEAVNKRLANLESASRKREEQLDRAVDKLKNFLDSIQEADNLLGVALDEVKRLKPVGSEPEVIRSQQEETRRLREEVVEPAGAAVDASLALGQELVASAAPGVSTNAVEKECERLTDRWSSLKEKMIDRERRLDVGLLQSGKFQEAVEGLSKWLTDTEEMVANQKPPSSDYKVVKAQLQEQKFLKKMLVDRQGSMSSLVAMGREVAANCDASERAGIEKQLRSLADRFDDLTERADARTSQLEQAMAVAKEFHDKLRPIVDWLDRSEKKIRDMELVPTDEEKITQKIREHSALHDDILRKKPALSELTEIAGELAGLVGDDEASAVADRVQELADRYSDLVNRSEGVGSLLENARARLRHLVVSYQKLQGWMQNMESRLAKYKVLAVHTEQLLAQMEDLADLTEEISNEQSTVDSTVDAGLELMKNISSDEAIQLKDKLDSLQRRYNELTSRGADLLKSTETALPLVQQFHGAHNRLSDWMHSAEATLQSADLREDAVQTLEVDVQEFRPVLENINQLGPQVCAIGPGEGAATIEGLVTRDNRRFDAIAQEVRRRSERVRASKQRSAEVLGDVDSLLEWFREVDAQLREAEAPSSEPHVIRLQLKEHKALNDDIAAQKGRVRDVLDTAKRLLRETAQFEDGSSAGIMRDKMADLRETMDSVWTASGERLGLLESALGLAVHFDSSHSELVSWLEEKEREAKSLRPSVLRPQALIQDQAVTQRLLQSISEHKPLVDKLNKTGEALIQVVQHEEGIKVQELLDSDNARYDDLKKLLKNRQDALEKALQESSEFSDKLEGMLRALTNAHDEMASAEPVSSHPPKIRQQLKENDSLMDDVAKREDAFEAIKKAARDVIAKSPNDPAIKDIKRKMDKLETLWNDVRDATKSRKRSLDEALDVASKFWNQLESVVNALAEIEANLLAQEPPALKPNEVQMQTVQLQNIGTEIEETKPRVDEVRRTGAKLMNLVGDSEKPEVRKNIEDMDSAWDTVTSLFAKRRENLITAMEVAMEFHENLRSINEALDKGEARFAGLGPLGEDIGTIRRQMNDVKDLKAFLDPMMVKVESLNRQAAELFERSSADQAQGLKEAVYLVNSRWDDLQRGMAERNRQLENALLRLGQFQQALQELLAWIAATDRSLDTDLSPTAVDTHLLEIQLAKLKVLMNDMAAHQTSVEALNDAGRQIIEEGRSKSDSDSIQEKLADLNSKWKKLMNKASERQTELEEALRQSHRFAAEIQDTLTWLGEIDSVMAASKPVGGLPETAAEQLDRFMVVYNELEEARPRVEAVLARGAERLKKSASAESSAHLAASLKTLKSRWESVTARANDKKIKLEIALKEAREFHDALQNFVDWLTSAEKTLSNLKPVSRVLETILGQIEEHKSFQKEVGTHREAMVQLDRQGTHLKYFCQKQDVILIKNLLVSVQHRWERVVSKSAERTRALDHGYKEAKDYHDSWFSLMSWLTDASTQLDAALREESSRTEEPAALKSRLSAHRELQKAVAAKQPSYDSVMRMGKALRDKAPKNDESALKSMAAELKELWNSVCSKAVERQRNLEEALLYCGQVKDALEALLEWLRRTHKELAEDGLVHGDLDTVQMLIEGHKKLEQELENRRPQVESVERSGRELSNKSESRAMSEQISEMGDLWRKTTELARKRGIKLQNALKQAEELHKAVHMLLEWLSDAEMKLRFVDSLPDDESETRVQISEHEKFLRELNDKEREKDSTIRLAEEILSKAHPDGASVVKHWITIIQSRWEEVSSWAKQRRDMLQTQLRALQDMDSLLAELLAWLADKEATLASQEVTPLPDTIPATQRLIDEHTLFMEDMAKRTHEVDTVIKAKTVKERKQSKKTSETRQSSSELHELQRKQSISLRSSREALDRRGSRSSPTKDVVDSTLPHIGPKFPAKGSKTPEPQFKCTRSRQLYDRWRSVWLMAWERQRRLRDHLAHLGELERLANFSWDEWRKRFLRFMNHKKSRLTDLFRKMDKNNDGLIPRDDFIDGIIKTKFDTSKLEMGAVADMFDHNAVGLIDWKEFIAALRPDWEERKPDTEAEKIHDEVKRLVMLCTCRQKFRVFQVGEGKYRFGDSQKLRLVRILRSTVMVRVGGGWVALEEFLVKNDPCRVEMLPIPNPFIPEEHEPWCPLSAPRISKGRTNIELREQFILADNVSQSMSAFKPKLSTERRTPTPTSSTGPITKIREKSTRSVPMTTRGTPTAGSRGSRGSAGSLSDVDSVSAPMTPSFRKSSLRTPVSTLGGGSLPGSRSSSRQGSKPPSRHGSSLSLASSDDGGGATTPSSSRIPRRSAPSRTGSSASTSQTTAQRRATAPSTPRGTNLSRASSIPTLISHRSKIPVYVGNSDTSQISSASSSGTPKTPSSAGRK